jgi:hypothetical protein
MTYRTDLQTYGRSVTLLDVLDRILDKGVVIIGDITVSIGDVELLSIKLKLLIASVETAEKMGIDFGWAGKSDQKIMELEEKVKTLEAKQLVPARARRR